MIKDGMLWQDTNDISCKQSLIHFVYSGADG